MEWSNYNTSQDIKDEIPKAYNSNIRLFRITRSTAEYPQDDCMGQWAVCDSNSLKGFSAVGYFFGKKLNASLNVPIGLVTTAWGGTPVEVWTPSDIVNSDPVLKQTAAMQVPKDWWPYLPGKTYNAMIAPLTNFPIAGAIWYQGEANTVWPDTYSQQLNTMIDSWRKAWNKEFPFYYVQIAPFTSV
jgi:sialate O-acetylesterase